MIDISHITPQGQAGLEIKHVLAEIIAAIDGGGTGGDGITGIIVDGSSLPIDSGNVTLGNASLLSTGSEEGDVVVLSSDGKIDSALLPSISITDTVVCSDESITTEEELKAWAEEQGLEQGDMIIVSNGTDLTGTYVVLSDGSLQAISTPSAGAITGITVNGDAVSVDNGVASIVDVVFTDDLKDFVTGEGVDEKIASATAEIEAKIPSLDGYATTEYVDEQVDDINKLIDETKEAIEDDITAVDTKLADYAKKTDIADFITAEAVAETYATKDAVEALNTLVDDNAKSIAAIEEGYLTKTEAEETYATKAEIPDVNNFTTQYISTDESHYEYVVNRISNADGTVYGEIFNELDGGGARFMNTETKLKGFVGVNDGSDEMYAQIYALNDETKEGTRINVYQDMICYSSTATSAAGVYSAENEIAVKGDITKLEEKIATLEAAIEELQNEYQTKQI